MRSAASAALVVLLSGCAGERPATTPAPPAPTASGACTAGKVQAYVGRPVTPDLAQAARNAADARSVRTITPGSMVTMDYRADRLNLTVDAKGVIISVRCG